MNNNRIQYQSPSVEVLTYSNQNNLLASLSLVGNVEEWQEILEEDLNLDI